MGHRQRALLRRQRPFLADTRPRPRRLHVVSAPPGHRTRVLVSDVLDVAALAPPGLAQPPLP